MSEKSHGQRRLAGYHPWGHKRVRYNLVTKHHHHLLHTHTDTHTDTQILFLMWTSWTLTGLWRYYQLLLSQKWAPRSQFWLHDTNFGGKKPGKNLINLILLPGNVRFQKPGCSFALGFCEITLFKLVIHSRPFSTGISGKN